MKELDSLLIRLDACDAAKDWLRTQPDPETAWEKCTRGDWMLWFAARAGVDRRLVALAACDCAETSLHLASPDGQMAGALALYIARAWVTDQEDLETVRAAAEATEDAAADDDETAAVYAASAAAYVYACAYDAHYAAVYAASAASAAYVYACYATSAAAAVVRSDSLRLSAGLVRANIPWRVVKPALSSMPTRRRTAKGW